MQKRGTAYEPLLTRHTVGKWFSNLFNREPQKEMYFTSWPRAYGRSHTHVYMKPRRVVQTLLITFEGYDKVSRTPRQSGKACAPLLGMIFLNR